MISFTCPHCKNPFGARPQHAGKIVTCPHCRKPVGMPAIFTAQVAAVHAGPRWNKASVPTTAKTARSEQRKGRARLGLALMILSAGWFLCLFLLAIHERGNSAEEQWIYDPSLSESADEMRGWDEPIREGEYEVRIRVQSYKEEMVSKIVGEVRSRETVKVGSWRFWKFGVVRDEHGNRFWPTPLGNYRAMSSRQQDAGVSCWYELPTDFRLEPKETMSFRVFYDHIPSSSRKAIVRVRTNQGRKIEVRGDL